MFVGSGFVCFDCAECRNLKEKRALSNSLIGKAKNYFKNAAFADVGKGNEKDKITIGFAVISNDEILTEKLLYQIKEYLEKNAFRTILESRLEIYQQE